MMNREIGKTRN